MIYVLDTNICIYYIEGDYPEVRKRFCEHRPSEIRIPTIVLAELMVGAQESSDRDVGIRACNRFVAQFEFIDFTPECAAGYAAIRNDLRSRSLKMTQNDLIIAATAFAFGYTLVTNNVKDFSRVKGLRIENWTE